MTTQPRHAGGQPTLLTPALQQEFVGYVEQGAYPESAARACGIGVRTYHLWMQRGRAAAAWQPPADLHPFEANDAGRCAACGKTVRAKVHEIPPRPDGVYLQFMQEVEQARGKARVAFESVFVVAAAGTADKAGDWRAAHAWLRTGPGRDRGAEDPGWTDRVEVVYPQDEELTAMLDEVAEELGTDPAIVAAAMEAASSRAVARAKGPRR